jgi:hypothetical protein
MYTKSRELAMLAATMALIVGVAAGDEDRGSGAARAMTPALAGVAAGTHFTDAQGNPRVPTVEERAALAAAFQRDLVELTRGKAIPAGSRRERSGAVSAVLGADRLRFLTATVDEAGNVAFAHGDAARAIRQPKE